MISPRALVALLVCVHLATVASIASADRTVSLEATQSPSVPQASLVTPEGATDYLVGASDVLKVTVFNEDKLSGSFRVDSDGSITFPMIGRLQVSGRTPRSIEQLLTTALENGYLRRPTVAVEVQDFRSRTVFIVGHVRNAGMYALKGEMNVMEALSMAGSIAADASKQIRVLRPRTAEQRRSASLPGAGTDAEVIVVDLAAIERGNMAGNIALQDGDTIVVPEAERFFVTGHVRSPGSYVLARGMTVQQAIAVAGGVTERGSSRRLKVKREDVSRPGQFIEVDVRLTDRVLPGDTILVPQRLI